GLGRDGPRPLPWVRVGGRDTRGSGVADPAVAAAGHVVGLADVDQPVADPALDIVGLLALLLLARLLGDRRVVRLGLAAVRRGAARKGLGDGLGEFMLAVRVVGHGCGPPPGIVRGGPARRMRPRSGPPWDVWQAPC